MKEVRDWIAPVPTEIPIADLDPWWRLPALVFRLEQLGLDVGDERNWLASGVGDFIHRHFPVDQTFEDSIEHRIGRQAILILLVRAELRRGWFGDDAGGHHGPGGAESAIRL